MKTLRLITIICAMAFVSLACNRKEKCDAELEATFILDMPLTKALTDAASATQLSVRVFDANHNFLYKEDFSRGENGWDVRLKLVPGTYSFSFWATSPEADAFVFDGEYMTLSYGLMDMNSDTEDAFWASVADLTLTTSFTRNVTLKRPFAFMQLVSNSFINESLDGATSSFTITGAVPTRMNLITGETDTAARKAIYTAAPLTEYTVGRNTIAAAAFVLATEEEMTVSSVAYNITFKDGRYINGTVENVPLARNHKTELKDY